MRPESDMYNSFVYMFHSKTKVPIISKAFLYLFIIFPSMNLYIYVFCTIMDVAKMKFKIVFMYQYYDTQQNNNPFHVSCIIFLRTK